MGARSWAVAAGTYTTWTRRTAHRKWDTHCQRRDRRPRPQGEYGRRPVIGDPIGTVSPVGRRGGRRDACTLSVALGPRHPLDGRLVSAYRRSTGQCATWTRGTTRRRGAEARPRPGQTKAPTPSARLLGNPQNFKGMKSTPVRTPATTTHDVPTGHLPLCSEARQHTYVRHCSR